MEKMQKLILRMQKLNFPGTHWRGLAVIGAQKKTLSTFPIPCEFPQNWPVYVGKSGAKSPGHKWVNDEGLLA